MSLFEWLIDFVFGKSERRPVRPARPVVPKPAVNVPKVPIQVAASTPAASAPGIPTKPATPKKAVKLNLEAVQFTPIARSEIKSRMSGLGRALWTNPWFGRRDLIPPATDERTNVIDRAMVSQGLLSPEELVEIHAIGDEMEKIRPDLAHAAHQADLAVKAAESDREALKARKKQEAAERKKKRAEEILRRRETDIFFLGRGVSGGLSDRRANVERLEKGHLPILAHPQDVAQALGVTIKRLRWLAFHAESAGVSHYVRFIVPKRSGGKRELAAPHEDLARCQSWILENILSKVPLHEAAHGFAPKHSTLTNAKPHVGRQVVVNCDLKDFFPSIGFARVRGLFHSLGYSPAAATILALLCTEAPRRRVQFEGVTYHVATGSRALPQGACTSPAISNLVARHLDGRLSKIAQKLGWNYTRYADDLTFSASGEAAQKTGYLLARIRHIAEDEGFSVNEEKTRVQRPNVAQSVTGIVVNARPGVPRKLVRRIRAILHRAKKEGLAAQNREGREHFNAWLAGNIAYIAMVNPKQGQALKASLQALAERSGGAA